MDGISTRTVAQIDERTCIGCALCIAACPVDAIVGAAKLMHTVLADRCTGCELCLPPCPVECIALVLRRRPWTAADDERALTRTQARDARLAGQAAARPARAPTIDGDIERERRRQVVATALARARARRAAARLRIPNA